MRRVLELMRRVAVAYPSDSFFDGALANIRVSRQARAYYASYDRALVELDSLSFEELSRKAIAHFRDHRPGQLKQGFFHQMNEAFAYRHLVRLGYTDITVLKEGKATQPDLAYKNGSQQLFCEVKTIGISEDEIGRRGSNCAFTANYHCLSEGFFNKLDHDLRLAQGQIHARGQDGLVYVVVTFDDFTMTYYPQHRQQLREFLRSHTVKNVYIKAGIVGSRGISSLRLRDCDA
jgi:hypothetical protein